MLRNSVNKAAAAANHNTFPEVRTYPAIFAPMHTDPAMRECTLSNISADESQRHAKRPETRQLVRGCMQSKLKNMPSKLKEKEKGNAHTLRMTEAPRAIQEMGTPGYPSHTH